MSEETIFTPAPAPEELTQDEKAYAGLAHALMISTWWIGPLIIFLMKKESRFVKFHALQALFWQIIFTIVYVTGFISFFLSMLYEVFSVPHGKTPQPPPFMPAQFFGFLLFWVVMMGCVAISWILGIVYCLKAMRGQWAGYPVIGRWVRRLAGV